MNSPIISHIFIFKFFIILCKLDATYSQFTIGTFDTASQCPCVMRPGSSQCLKYDSRYQATSIEEAISFFDDLSLQSEYKPPEQETSIQDQDCTTRQCKVCKSLLRQKLRAVGLFRGLFQESGFENFIDPSSTESHLVENTCHKYRFSRKNTDALEHHQLGPKPPKKPKKKKEVVKEPDSDDDDDSDGDSDEKQKNRNKRKKPPQNQRHRRQTANNATEVVDLSGIRYNLSCTSKGSAVDGKNDLISLCAKCWAWRQLPVNYFPQFVNELVCHDNDLSCLSGYAKCGAATHAVEVIRNDTGKLSVMTLTAGSFCECQVYAGSALQSLVMGTGGTVTNTSAGNFSLNVVTDGGKQN